MNKYVMCKKIFAINENYVDISNSLKDCRDLVIKEDNDGLRNHLTKILVESELATIELRKLMAQNVETKPQMIELDSKIVDANDISIEENDKVLSIKMPIILPFKKVKDIRRISPQFKSSEQSNDYIIEALKKANKLGLDNLFYKVNAIVGALDIAMQRYCVNSTYEERIKLYSNGTYVFTNYFKYEPGQLSPDPDNMEYKQIIDIVARYLSCGNDNHIKIIIQNKPAKSSYTELKVYPNTFELIPQKVQK